MQIHNTQANYTNKYKHKNPSHKGGAEFIKALADTSTFTSLVATEAFSTGGRSYNAYKRGGKDEFRERFTDNVVSAIFWFSGITALNKIGDKIGEHIFHIEDANFDVGKDALRTPFQNLKENVSKQINDPEAAKKLINKITAFKFTKVLLSAILGTFLVGFVLPKANQFVTKKIKEKKAKDNNTQTNNNSQLINGLSIEEFGNKINKNSSNPAFKGVDILSITHNLENNPKLKLAITDVGILGGRVATARNADEAREFLIQDSIAPIFYYLCTPAIYAGFQLATRSKKLTEIDTVAAKQIIQHAKEQIKQKGAMNVNDFAKNVIGTMNDNSKNLLKELHFNSDVISLSELQKHIKNSNLINKAKAMAELQPKQAGIGAVLTKQQVEDVLKNGSLNSPEFMKSIFSTKFKEDLTNPLKFIPMEKITGFRQNIDDYANEIIKIANKKNNGMVTEQLLKQVQRKSFTMSAIFRIIAIVVPGLCLGFVVPKLQQAVTAKITGSSAAPGLRELDS